MVGVCSVVAHRMAQPVNAEAYEVGSKTRQHASIKVLPSRSAGIGTSDPGRCSRLTSPRFAAIHLFHPGSRTRAATAPLPGATFHSQAVCQRIIR